MRPGIPVGPFEVVLRDSTAPLTVDDLRQRAGRRLPRMVRAYLENGADDERNLAVNRAGWSRWQVRQRVLAGISEVDLATRVAGVDLALPVLLGPVGLAGALRGSGDVAAARAAEASGTRLTLSTGSTHTLEEVATGTAEDHFFQLYPWGDRRLIGSLLDRAEAAGYHALFVTADVPVVGNRLGEQRHGMGTRPRVSVRGALDVAAHPGWMVDFLRHRRIALANLAEPGGKVRVADTVRQHAINMRPDLSWEDLAWMRSRWKGPVFLKGVLHPDDASRAVEVGCDGVVVSNHGGRQLSPAQATADVLPEIVDRVGGQCQILVDGGIRSGSDVVTALALGADAVLLGRAWAYGLAADGQSGVTQALRILADETRRTMHLAGVADVAGLGADVLVDRGA